MPQGSKPSWVVCIPTLNAGSDWTQFLAHFKRNTQGSRLVVVDSASDDETAELARLAGADVWEIKRGDFDHGATRDWALRHLHYDIVVFMTQDALPTGPDSVVRLVSAFDDPDVGAVFGRQLPHSDATPIAAHARLFNYPEESRVVSQADIPRLGIKTAFLSNSFAAYRREALIGAGGFPAQVILGEDMIAGARLLQTGWKLAYCAEATVNHSHNYSLGEEFRRYFDIGVMHARERWLIELLGQAEGEGGRFLRSEFRFLWRQAPALLPQAFVRNALKYLGYRLGRAERHLALALKRRCSMHTHFWVSEKPQKP